MKRKATPAARLFVFLALFLVAALCASAQAENYDAGTMRLLRCQGAVEIYDASGTPRFVMENVRFASGEALETGSDGLASVSLDDTKIVTLDASSRVEFVQEGSHLLLTLAKGTIFLDVQEKLDENESLDIQTTTMTVGIRGTIVFMRQTEGGTVFGVMEGKSQVSYTDSSGGRRMMSVDAGQLMTVQEPAEGVPGVSPVVTEMTRADVEGFVIDRVMEDEATVERVRNGSPAGPQLLGDENPSAGGAGSEGFTFPADGEWTWEEPVTLVAQSASKLYDGEALTRHSDVLVYGLPEGLNIRVSASGAQTNAGSSANPVGSYTITNAAGETVTDHFSNIRLVSGRLRVDPVRITVWTGSAEKYYDGEPLACEEAELHTAPGYVYGDAEWRNTSLVTRTALGSEAMISVAGCTWVHGTNPLTGATEEIPLFTGQRMTVCIHDTEGAESIEFAVETLAPAELPEDVLRLYADNPGLLAQACEDAGWDPETVAELIAALPPATGATAVRHGVRIGGDAAEDLMRDSANVRITIDTEITNYNSRPLNGEEAHFTPIRLDPAISVVPDGSRTEPGESENTYHIDWGTANPANYVVVGEELGTLTVLPVHEGWITLTAASAGKVYDGAPLKDDSFEVSGLPDGYTAAAVVSGSRTDAGESENRITAYHIFDSEGNDVTESFPHVAVTKGTLAVAPAPLSVSTGSAEKVYDGEPLECGEAELAGFVNGETASVSATGSLTSAGSAENTYAIEWGTAKAGNYTIVSEETGTLTVQPLSLALNCGGAETEYTGSAYTPVPVLTYLNGPRAGETAGGANAGGQYAPPSGAFFAVGDADSPAETVLRFALFTGDVLEVSVSGAGTAAGSYTLAGSVSAVSGSMGDFAVSFTGTSLVIMPRALSIATPSDSKAYDGTPLTAGPAEITGLAEGEEIAVTVTGTVTDVGTAENSFTVDWGSVSADNYTVTETPGSLEVTVNDTPVTIAADSAGKVFDGTELSCGTYTVSGLPEGLSVEAATGGSLTDAGSTANTLQAYAILDPSGKDVTAFFSDVTPQDGTLTVEPLQILIDAGADGMNGVYGNIEMKDESVTYVNGEHAGEKIEYYNGIAMAYAYRQWANLYTGDEFIKYVLYGEDFMNAGDHTIVVDAYINSGNAGNYSISVTNTDYTITPAPVTVTAASASRPYDGTALTAPVTITGLTEAERKMVTLTATGTITDAGSVPNSYTLDWGVVKKSNYTVTEVPGTLTVTPLNIGFVIQDPVATFDNGYHYAEIQINCAQEASGEFLGDTGYRIRVGDAMFEMTFSTNARRKNAGSHNLSAEVSSWIYGTRSNYNVTVTNGSVTVNPRPITIVTGSATKAYNGVPLISSLVSVTGFNDTGAIIVTPNGSITDAGSKPNTYTIDWNGWEETNYIITEYLGTLEVTKAPVTVTTGSASKVFDGTPLTASAGITGLAPADRSRVTVTPSSRTDAGSGTNNYTIDWGGANPENYTVSENLGTLTVEKLQLSFEIGSVSMDYCGSLPDSKVPAPRLTATVLNGDHAGETISGRRQTNVDGNNQVSYFVYFYQFPTGQGFALSVNGFNAERGTHTLNGSFNGSSSYPDTRLSNYSVTITPGTFTVN